MKLTIKLPETTMMDHFV